MIRPHLFVLSDDLKALQSAPSARPYITVTVRNTAGSAPRPRWTLLYTGTEGDDVHAAAVAADGSPIRLRCQSGTDLYRQRVSTPGEASDFSAWTLGRAGTRLGAVAASGVELRAIAVDNAAPTQLYESVSSDNGATWTAWSLLETAASTVTSLASAADPATTSSSGPPAPPYTKRSVAGEHGALRRPGPTP